MSLFLFVLGLGTANLLDLLIHKKMGWGTEKRRLVPAKRLRKLIIEVTDIKKDPLVGTILLFLFMGAIARIFRGTPTGWEYGGALAAFSYGAFVLFEEPEGRSFLKKWFGKAWGKIRKRLGLPERLFLTEEEKVLRGLEAGLLAQIGDSPLLTPLRDDVRRLVRVEAPRLIRLLDQNREALRRVQETLAQTKGEQDSPERARTEQIEERLNRRVLEQGDLLKGIRRKLVHLGPVVEDVRASLEGGDGTEVQEAVRYLDELTSAIHASVAEDAPALPAADPPADRITTPPARTRVS